MSSRNRWMSDPFPMNPVWDGQYVRDEKLEELVGESLFELKHAIEGLWTDRDVATVTNGLICAEMRALTERLEVLEKRLCPKAEKQYDEYGREIPKEDIDEYLWRKR